MVKHIRPTFYAKKFCTQIVQVYLQPLRPNSLLKCAPQTKIAKKILKPSILRVQGHSRSSMFTPKKKKSVTSACYGKQYVSVYLQLFLR